MRHRFTVAGFLVLGLLSAQALLGATQGGVKGRVLVDLKGLEGVPLTLVNVSTGQSFSVRTARDGSYSLSLPSGSYVVASAGVRGLSIGKAPLVIQVTAGRFASANIEMARVLRQESANEGTSIFHNPIACVAKNEFPVFDTTFRPAGSVVSARLYFKSNLSDEWFYTEFQTLSGDFPKYKWTMTPDPSNPAATTQGDDVRRRWVGSGEPEPIDPGVPPTHRAFLPKVKEGSGIVEVTYYIQLTLADFTESRNRDTVVKVQGQGEACKGFSAPAGVPNGLSVLTASGAAAAPAGFGGVGLTLAAELVGAGAGLLPLAVAGAVVAAEDSPAPTATPVAPIPTPAPSTPTPTPGPTPSPTPTPGPPRPTPTPTPTPAPAREECRVQVSINPPGGPTSPCWAVVSAGGPAATVTSTQTFTVSCSSSVRVEAFVGPPASFFFGPQAISWSGACSGDATGTPCVLSPALPTLSTLVLECGCDSEEFPGFASTCGQPGPYPSPFGS